MRENAKGWMIWFTILFAATTLLVISSSEVHQEQASLTFILVVLGGSIAGGRPLGFTLAIVSTALIDFLFQEPYGELAVPARLDIIVLASFTATAFVATELFTRARTQAAEADARKNEVETLARMGAETLRYASASEAFEAIAARIRGAIGADYCAIHPWSSRDHELSGALAAVHSPFENDLLIKRALDERRPALEIAGGAVALHDSPDISTPAGTVMHVHALAAPLIADEKVIGVLVVRSANQLVLDGPRRRLLAGMSYYATLGIERMRLMSAAAYSEAVQESQRAKEEVFAAVSHDLRTPISTIKVLAQSGADRGEAPAEAIVEQADRLARLVGDLLEMSRFRAGGTRLVPEINTIEDLIGAALRQSEGNRRGRTIDVTIDFESPALVGRFDFVHTLRIVGNLLDNALRHSPPDGTVEVRADRSDGWLVIDIADRGTGVIENERERIFEAFYRPADASPDGGHSGLGLSIAKSLAERQGGSVTYAPRGDGGSVFTLRLPAADLDDLVAESA